MISRHFLSINGKLVVRCALHAESDDDCTWRYVNGHTVCIKGKEGEDKPEKSPVIPKFHDALTKWTKFHHGEDGKGGAGSKMLAYSYVPSVGKAYDAIDNQENRAELYKMFSDGKNDVYFVGVTNHLGEPSRESEASYLQVQNEGHIPLMGYWYSNDSKNTYNDISFPVDHGLGDDDAIKMLQSAGQEEALVIRKNGDAVFIKAPSPKIPKGSSKSPFTMQINLKNKNNIEDINMQSNDVPKSRVDEDGAVWYENTFMPQVENKELTLGMISRALFMGFNPDKLPKAVREAVENRLKSK